MHKALLLTSAVVLLAGPLSAQTMPTAPATAPASAPTPAAKEEKSPWLIFDQPLDTVPRSRSKAAQERPVRKRPDRSNQPAPAQSAAAAPNTSDPGEVEPTQGATYVPLDPDTYRLIERYAIKYGPDKYNDPHTSVRPYSRAAAGRLAERLLGKQTDSSAVATATLSRADQFNAEYLLQDNWANTAAGAGQSARPLLKYFYQNPVDFFHVATKDFTLRVNPVALLQAGRDNKTDGLRYINTRGLQLEGTIDQRLGFYTFLADNQMAVPLYVQERIQRDQVVPHEGYWKYFKTVGGSQYDFFTARGGITYAATKHINVQLAHDRNFIGNGYRSLILSDYSAPYFFLKLNTRIWKFNYQNLFAELIAERRNEDQIYPKKYMAMHHLSFDVTPSLNIGVFESTIHGGSAGRGGFELQYLNPLIFYRAIEQNVGSPDNAILGMDFKWNIFRTAQLYGQVVLDEFKISEMRAGNGWWANKQAAQVGAKYIDVAGLRNLDLQVEFNYIRPFTYQHTDIYTNYQHYQQPLAHPMGANVSEVLGVLSYQPLPRLMLVAKAFYSKQGLDSAGVSVGRLNYGGNVLKSYNTRVQEYGNTTGQGNTSRLLHADFTATYQPRLNLFVDAKLIARRQTYSLTPAANQNVLYPSLALRWNIAQRLHEF